MEKRNANLYKASKRLVATVLMTAAAVSVGYVAAGNGTHASADTTQYISSTQFPQYIRPIKPDVLSETPVIKEAKKTTKAQVTTAKKAVATAKKAVAKAKTAKAKKTAKANYKAAVKNYAKVLKAYQKGLE